MAIDKASAAYKTRHKLYDTKQWYRMRYYHLQDNPLCVFCFRDGITTAANVVDHITPHRGDEALFYDDSNLQSLCKHCHDSEKSRLERNSTMGHDEFGNPVNKTSKQHAHWFK